MSGVTLEGQPPEVRLSRIVTAFVPDPNVEGVEFGVAPSPVSVMLTLMTIPEVHVQVPVGI